MTTILCVGSFFKGNEFLATCKQEGHTVVLLTVEALLGKPWAREAIDKAGLMYERRCGSYVRRAGPSIAATWSGAAARSGRLAIRPR